MQLALSSKAPRTRLPHRHYDNSQSQFKCRVPEACWLSDAHFYAQARWHTLCAQARWFYKNGANHCAYQRKRIVCTTVNNQW